jgi:cytochrome c553
MRSNKKLLLLLTLFITTGLAKAADIEAGKNKAILCAACHGTDGIATQAIYPNLAGQNEVYLASALKAYREKQRNGGMASIMQIQAANLSDEDIANLAAYFASLK